MNAWEKIDTIILLLSQQSKINRSMFSHEYLGNCSDIELDRILESLQPARPSTTQMSDDEIPRQELLKKILGQTTNDNDHVALMAMRKANAILAEAGWDWNKLIDGKIKVAANPFANLRQPPAAPSTVSNPTTPKRPTFKDLDGNTHFTQQDCDAANQAIRARRRAPRPSPPPPSPKTSVFPVIGSQYANKFANNCYVCGDWTDQNLGFIFKPHDVLTAQKSPGAAAWPKSKWHVCCKTCNNRTNFNLDIKPAPVKGGPAKLADLI